MSLLADDRDELRRIGTALRLRQQEHYSLARHLDRLESLYQSLTSGHD